MCFEAMDSVNCCVVLINLMNIFGVHFGEVNSNGIWLDLNKPINWVKARREGGIKKRRNWRLRLDVFNYSVKNVDGIVPNYCKMIIK